MSIRIYCDGACSGNPGLSGAGVSVYVDNKKPKVFFGRFREEGTNNIAELEAFIFALDIAKKINRKDIEIYCDSMYVINSITKWADGWKKKGWKRSGKGGIKNLELIKEAHRKYLDIIDNLSILHVKGHTGVQGNELADRMAILAITKRNKKFKEFKYKSL